MSRYPQTARCSKHDLKQLGIKSKEQTVLYMIYCSRCLHIAEKLPP